ncbi:hypothetical protein PsorP6_012286 [Peronosclerospora sorghi]|uniref:Uncharacterized protein n=1 Tax=Peronosclerospora sorghi TaxID=230839 RepID=A0ACC0WLF2_9STRA|nr:hypothetical protein PsorP6_012286 [Peronosclerospora sorghi]
MQSRDPQSCQETSDPARKSSTFSPSQSLSRYVCYVFSFICDACQLGMKIQSSQESDRAQSLINVANQTNK